MDFALVHKTYCPIRTRKFDDHKTWFYSHKMSVFCTHIQ